MQCVSKEDGNFVLLHQGEIGNKLRRLIKLELFFLQKTDVSPFKESKNKRSLNKIAY